MSVQPIPAGFGSVTPHLVLQGAAAAIDFYKRAFGAVEVRRMPAPDGRLMHAEIKIGGSMLMLADEFPEYGQANSPKSRQGTTVGLHMFVEDTDAAFERAIAAGATAIMPPMDMFWGDRYGKPADPFGHEWAIATHLRDLSAAEMAQAAVDAFAQPGCQEG